MKIRELTLKGENWYSVASYPGEGIYLLTNPDNGDRCLVIYQEGSIWSTYIYSEGTALSQFIVDALEEQNKPEEKSGEDLKDESELCISEDLFLKTLAIARGQELMNLTVK